MRVEVKNKNILVATNVKLASTFFSRLKGLMFVKEMKNMDGLIIENCKSIHNCFVRFSLDVVFFNKEYEVVKIIRNFKPWYFSGIYFRAWSVLEMPAGKLPSNVHKGDVLEVSGV